MAAARTPGSGATAPGPQTPCAAARRHPAQRGFTLIELLVALALMALMAAMSWRGLDAMAGAQKRLAQHQSFYQILSLLVKSPVRGKRKERL
jgi:hypothetical protein